MLHAYFAGVPATIPPAGVLSNQGVSPPMLAHAIHRSLQTDASMPKPSSDAAVELQDISQGPASAPAPAPYAGPPESAAPIEIDLQRLSPMLAALPSVQTDVSNAPSSAPNIALQPNSDVYGGSQTCEQSALSQLGIKSWVNGSTGYTLNITWGPQHDTLWPSLGCLQAVTGLQLSGSMPQLPDAWASNGSFPLLQTLSISSLGLSGTLPSSWGQNGAFPSLQTLYLFNTSLAGTLPTAWASEGSFANLMQLNLQYNFITGMRTSLALHAML